jgi:hypothetical protein
MNKRRLPSLAVLGLTSIGSLAVPGGVGAQEATKTVQMPQPGVPQIMTLEGRYVRAAYNNEGYVILGYRIVNLSVGEPWILLEVGVALREGVKDYDLTRDAVSLETPDGKTIPLPTVQEYRAANLSALQNREKVQRDSINYFPPNADQACRIGFFAELDQRALPWDQVELSDRRACLGRLFFQVPGGITYGQHWLNVKFANSLVRVPFRVLTKEEDKLLDKHFDSIKKQVDNAFKKKAE